MAVEYDISSDVAVIKETGSVSQCARVTQMYSGQITYDDEAGSKFATATINGKSQRVMLCIAVSGTVTYDDVPSLYSTVDGHRCLNIVTPTETGTPDDVPSLYETVVIDGQNVRAVRCIMINKTPVYDGVSSVCTFTGDDGKTHTAQLVNKITGGSVQVIIKGTSPLVLPDAIANSLSYVKAFGGTEQNGTPTPDTPVDIVSNNGVLRTQGSATGTVTQTGDPTPTTPVEPEFYQNHGLLLRAIGTDADTYDVFTQTITRNIGYYIFDGTESFGTSTAYGRSLYINGAAITWGASRSKDVLCQYFLGASSPSGTMPMFTCFFNQTGHFYFRTEETATDFKAWLAELYANGTPLIVWFVNSAPGTESFTSSVYADGTVETIEDTIGNTATAEMLLKVGDYQDEQEILSGAVTRKVEVIVFDGTETFATSTTYGKSCIIQNASNIWGANRDATPICTHFLGESRASGNKPDYTCFFNATGHFYFRLEDNTVATFKAWLAAQYATGTPVMVLVALATPTTESVAGQALQVTDGDNTLEITQASLTGLELEAQYNAAVSLTIQEVEDANLDNNVTVTIQ